MISPAPRREEVLNDSQATLRQVRGALAGLGAHPPEVAERVEKVMSEVKGRGAGLRDLVEILMSTYAEIMSVIESLRKSRGLLEQAAMERLKSTHAKLAEVSSATEMAATGMLDGLDRALVLVDRLDSTEGAKEESSDAGAIRGELRDELHTLINLLQFQDITAQQLGYAGGVLLDIEDRMVELARIFDVRGLGTEEPEEEPAEGGERECKVARASTTCDPAASNFDSDSRQALADEIFR